MVPRTRSNRHKLKHRRLLLNIGKHVFPVRVREDWHRLLKEVVEPPLLEILKSHLGAVLGNVLYVALLEQGVGPDNPSNFSHSVISKISTSLFLIVF